MSAPTVILAVQLASVSGFSCEPPLFKLIGDSCLLYSDGERDYVDAVAACKELYNATIVTAETAERRENLRIFVQTNGVTGDEFEYIGGRETEAEGREETDVCSFKKFRWQGFSTAAFWDRNDPKAFPDTASSWRSGEPDNTNGNEQCVCIKEDGLWNDCKCTGKRRFICEKRPTNLPTEAE